MAKKKGPAVPPGGIPCEVVGAANGKRILRVKISDLRPAGYNPRVIPEVNRAGLRASLTEFGMVEQVVWNARSQRVVGGHQRLELLEERGDVTTDVIEVDLDEIREKALNLALNNARTQGQWTAALADVAAAVENGIPDLARALLIPNLREDMAGILDQLLPKGGGEDGPDLGGGGPKLYKIELTYEDQGERDAELARLRSHGDSIEDGLRALLDAAE